MATKPSPSRAGAHHHDGNDHDHEGHDHHGHEGHDHGGHDHGHGSSKAEGEPTARKGFLKRLFG